MSFCRRVPADSAETQGRGARRQRAPARSNLCGAGLGRRSGVRAVPEFSDWLRRAGEVGSQRPGWKGLPTNALVCDDGAIWSPALLQDEGLSETHVISHRPQHGKGHSGGPAQSVEGPEPAQGSLGPLLPLATMGPTSSSRLSACPTALSLA